MKKTISFSICALILLLAFSSGCLEWIGKFKEMPPLQFDAEISSKNDGNNVINWEIGFISVKGGEKRIADVTWEILDANESVVWSGEADVSPYSLTMPTAPGVNYYDEDDDWHVDSGEEFSVKAPYDGYYKVKATYKGRTAWESSLKHY